MSSPMLIEFVKQGKIQDLGASLSSGADPNEQDESGWTALNWAAGKGALDCIQVLLKHGADPVLTGRDSRTPSMIARAAGHRTVAEALEQTERARGVSAQAPGRLYCKAYFLDLLYRFSNFTDARVAGDASEAQRDRAGERQIVYLHEDFTVTASVWHGEDVVFANVTNEWIDFCRNELQFEIPEDLL